VRQAWLATHVTNVPTPIRFRILGGLEAEVGDDVLELGGGKQRAVLGALLLRAGSVVADSRLIQEVWGESPPASSGHGLEAYVSRLRHELVPHGVSLERSSGGYRLDLGSASLDARVFEELANEALAAFAARSLEDAAARAKSALDLWRGPPLDGVPLHLESRGDAVRLEELRLRVVESYVDSSLALGQHRAVVGELRRLVDENPYREELVARLMVALYRSGRQAEALEVYERTRRVLMDDLGIQPGPELQHLSGQIVRHESGLNGPSQAVAQAPSRRVRMRGVGGVLVGVSLLAALAAVAVGLTWGGGDEATGTSSTSTRVALVLPRAPQAGREDTFVTPFVRGLMAAAREHDLVTRTFVADELKPTSASLETLRHELRTGEFDLVLWAGTGRAQWELLPLTRRLPATRFVYVDASVNGTPVEDAPNATGLTFADDGPGFLAGYLAGRVTARQNPLGRTDPVVSVIGAYRFPQVTALVDGFVRGAKKARPGVVVHVAYSHTFVHQPACERIANHQIDRGSTVVFAAAGTCSLGALAAAGLRGVWGVGVDADRSYLGSHILVSTVKRYDRAVELAVEWYAMGMLPAGDVILGLDDDAVGIAGISPEVSPGDRRSVARLAASLRKAEAARSPELPD